MQNQTTGNFANWPEKSQIRFWSHVEKEKESDCWLWNITSIRCQTSRFHLQENQVKSARRCAYILCVGQIPVGRHVKLICGKKLCVNPKHLTLSAGLSHQLKNIKIELDAHITNRFWALTDKSAGPEACWTWRGPIEENQPLLKIDNRNLVPVHVSYAISQQLALPIQGSITLTCGNMFCVNPLHLIFQARFKNIAKGIDNGMAKVTPDIVRSIRARRVEGITYLQIAKEFNLSEGGIYKICNRSSWNHVE